MKLTFPTLQHMNTAHKFPQIKAASGLVGLARPGPGLRAALLALAWPGLLLSSHVKAEETRPAPSPPAVSKPAAAPLPQPTAGSSWHRLGQSQRQALAPLATAWDSLNPAHKRKWLEVSKNFPTLGQIEQAKMHERMTEWAALKPQERAQARLNFGKTAEISKELTPAEKLAKWQAYQALPPEQRQELSDKAKTRPLGAAPAVKPVPAQKLAVVPPVTTAKASKSGDVPAAPAEPADSN